MSNIKETAKQYLQSGLSVVFLQGNKLPNLSGWKDLERQALTSGEVDTLFSGGSIRLDIVKEGKKKDGSPYTIKGFNFYPEKDPTYLGIIAGKVSGGLEVIDVDCKYDLTGSLWDEFKTLLKDNLGDTFNSLVIATTTSGGYHIYYRCEEIEGNLKLANRATSTKEKEATYQKNITSGSSETVAKNAYKNDKIRVLIETRGEGGYVVAPPSEGYKFIQGKPLGIPRITPQERACILAISRDFNQEEETPPQVRKAPTSQTTTSSSEITSLEDYDQRGDAVALLISHGWTEVGTSGERVNLLRPGETTAKSSGNYHIGKRSLIIFSTSTQFEPGKPYSPSQIFNLLECGGDWTKTAKELGSLGYGSKTYTSSKELKTEKITVEAVNQVTRETSVISSPGKTLTTEEINALGGKDIIITSPGSEAQDEVLRAIKTLQGEKTRIYIKEEAVEVREYKYQLQALFKKYGAIQQTSGGLSDRETDNLLDEVVIISQGLQPIDRDIFKGYFLSLEPIKELGITEESLSITEDRLTSTREKEAQKRDLNSLLSKVKEHQDKGETAEALELLDKKVKEVKLKAVSNLLPPPMSFTSILQDIATIPPGYRTGYPSLDKFIDFTPGAISLIGGRPSHGKTSFMFNLLLEMAKLYPQEKFYFLSYEEPVRNISVKLLNRLTGIDLKTYFTDFKLSSPTNYEFIKSYIKAGRTDIPQIEEGKRQLKELVDSQRITLIGENYSVEDLSKLIAHLQKKEKIGAVFIDYIQRMKTERRTQDKRTEIAHISDQTLQIAKDTGLPIILGAQLNRATTTQQNKKPILENLKEAGNLEEDANLVLSVYNESREKAEDSDGKSYEGVREVELEIKVLKNREGDVNKTSSLTFDKWTGEIKETSNSKDIKVTPKF
jgi:replicative DNA helicase